MFNKKQNERKAAHVKMNMVNGSQEVSAPFGDTILEFHTTLSHNIDFTQEN